MKKAAILLLVLASVCISRTMVAQEQNEIGEEMVFVKIDYNFGSIEETGGSVTHKFEFVNKGKNAIIITNVVAQCGCTTPTWTKEPIPPGQKGFVSAAYNPKNRPGKFNKSITVTSNAEDSPVVLRIRGDVIPALNSSQGY